MRLWTIGHSTRPLDELIALLKQHDIQVLIDVRHFPMSRHNPQFNRQVLEQELPKHNIEYIWLENLGGYRTDGYSKYMRTKNYRNALAELISIAKRGGTAIMCAELLFFKCHRRYIANSLANKGYKVVHIIDSERTYEHKPRSAYIKQKMKKKIRCDRK